MNFPIQIQDEAQFNRMVRAIQKSVVKSTVTEVLIQTGQLPKLLTKTECAKAVGVSEYHIDRAIKKGELAYVAKGRNRMIEYAEAIEWAKIDTLL